MLDEIRGFFTGRLPEGWFSGTVELRVDRDEIQVIGTLDDVSLDDAGDAATAEARRARIARFREETRAERIRIAREAQARFGRKVSWGARCGDEGFLFTPLSAPVMTRLGMRERQVLDTLVASGVARSRSHALAWCVRLVAEHEGEWIDRLNEALTEVEKVRAEGPAA